MKKVGKVLSVEGNVLVKHANGAIEHLKTGDIIEINDIVMCKNSDENFTMVMENGFKLVIGEHTYVLFDQNFINQFLQLTHHLNPPFYAEHSLNLENVDIHYKNYHIESSKNMEDENGFPYLLVKSILHVSVDDLITNDSTPPLNGNVDDADANIDVVVNGEHYTADNNGDGTWTLPDDTISPLDDGKYDVTVIATNPEGGENTSYGTVEIDTTAPVVNIDDVITKDKTPPLSGTVDDPDAKVTVTVGGEKYDAINNGDGTWTLPDNTVHELEGGDYIVIVTAEDKVGNVGKDDATLTIDTTPPVITVDDLVTNDSTPELVGTVDNPDAKIVVTVDGHEYDAVNNGDGTWTLLDDTVSPLLDNTYEVTAVATDLNGNMGEGKGNLTIDTTAPVITVDDLTTSDNNPPLTGTVDDVNAHITVTVDKEEYEAVNNGDGTWTLPDNTVKELIEGDYTVEAVATDDVGNSSKDDGNLIIDFDSPTVTINDTEITHDDTPEFTGTIINGNKIDIVLDNEHYSSADSDSGISINGDGTWSFTVPDSDALDDGDYTIDVTASNDKGKESSVSDDFTVDADMPEITIKDYDEFDTGTPTFEGTYSNANVVEVYLNDHVYTSIGEDPDVVLNEEEGTWSFTVPESNPLDLGDQSIEAIAKDEQGNEAKADDDFFVNYEVPPVAVDDIVLTNIIDGSTMELPDRAFIFNDYDLNNDPIHMYEVKNVEDGTMETEADGSIDNDHYANLYYTPDDSPFEKGAFEYSVTDGQLPSNDAHVTIIAASGNAITGTEEGEILVSAEREDEMFGGGGNDVFVCYDLSRIVDGGEGFDMLLAPNHAIINFNCFAHRVTDLEQLDVLMDDHDVTSVGVSDVLAITDENNNFQILGDEGDSVYLDAGWTYSGKETLTYLEHNIVDYNVYTGTADGQEVHLYVEDGVHVVG